jgi:DNA-binding NarL/FixJ family response regulator
MVVGISDRPKGLLNQLKGSEPDVLLLDWVSSSLQSIAELLGNLCNLEHRPKTIVFSTRAEDGEAYITAGADYFITKDAPPDELLPILNDIRLSGNRFIHKEK